MYRCFPAFAVAFLILPGCADTGTADSSSTTDSSSAVATAEPTLSDVLEQVQAGNAVLLDVRTEGEWNTAHFAKAVHIPVSDISSDKAAVLDKSKPVYVHCAAGKRAVTGADELKKLGFDAIALETSYDSIKEAGFEEAGK